MSLERTWRRRRGDTARNLKEGRKDYGFCILCWSGFAREGLIAHFRAFHPLERQPGDDYDERHGKSGKGAIGNR